METTEGAGRRQAGRPGSALRTLTTAQTISSVGDGTFYVTSALFFVAVVGLTPAQVGLGLSCAWGLGALTATPIGHLSDRLGARGSAVALAVVTSGGIVLLMGARTMAGFLAAASLYAVAQSGLSAVRQGLLVTLVAESERVTARARLQVLTNAGVAAGAGLGGAALAVGSDLAYLTVLAADALAFLLAGAVLLRLHDGGARPVAVAGGAFAVLRDRRFVGAAALTAVLYLYMPVLSVLLPMWVAERTAAPPWLVAGLLVLNTGSIVVGQRRLARTVTGLASAARSVAVGGALLAAACLILWSSAAPDGPGATTTATVALVAGGLVLAVGEMLAAAGMWEIGFALADPARPGQWQGLFSCGVPVARAVGPALLVLLVLDWSGPGWAVLALLFAASAVGLAAIAHRAATSRPAVQTRALSSR